MPKPTQGRPHPNSKQAQHQAHDARRSWLNRGIVGLVAVTLLTAAGIALLGGGSDAPDRLAAAEPSGTPAPNLSFDLFDGTRTSIEDFEGKPVVLNFWASWCPACVAEMPDFEAVHQAFGDEVRFLGIDTQDTSRSAADELVHSTGVSYALGLDPTGVIFREFGGVAMPTTVFIDADGNVVDTHSGALFADDLSARINDLFFRS